MSAIFDFSSVLMILLLMICTSCYLRELRPGIFDGSKVRCTVRSWNETWALDTWTHAHAHTHTQKTIDFWCKVNVNNNIIILSYTYLSFLSPSLRDDDDDDDVTTATLRILIFLVIVVVVNDHFFSWQTKPRDPNTAIHIDRTGFGGFCWKMSRVGERMSPFVGAGCLFMAAYVLFK